MTEFAPTEAGATVGDPIRVFLNYRRDDTGGHALHLYADLAARFGDESVFMDMRALEPGLDFSESIEAALENCDVVLCLVGIDWLTAMNDDGQRRIDDPDDWVRLELEAALQRKGLRVIPVLVERARMPRRVDLPEPLAPLARRHAFDLSNVHWPEDVVKLVGVLERVALQKAERAVLEQEERDRLALEDAEREVREHEEQEAHTEQARLAEEQAARERLAREEAEQAAGEQAEQERPARPQAEQERLAREQAERERLAREQAARERLAREEAERQRALEQAEQERLAQWERARQKLERDSAGAPATVEPEARVAAPAIAEQGPQSSAPPRPHSDAGVEPGTSAGWPRRFAERSLSVPRVGVLAAVGALLATSPFFPWVDVEDLLTISAWQWAAWGKVLGVSTTVFALLNIGLWLIRLRRPEWRISVWPVLTIAAFATLSVVAAVATTKDMWFLREDFTARPYVTPVLAAVVAVGAWLQVVAARHGRTAPPQESVR